MRQIVLSRNKVTVIDDTDFEEVSKYKWYWTAKSRSRFGYAVTDLRDKNNEFGVRHVTLHRFLIKPERSLLVDHINGNSLDNTRNNLRTCTPTQNNGNFFIGVRNKSGYKGVSWHKATSKWRATLLYKGKQQYLGLFNNKLDAAVAYNKAALESFGTFARLNVI